MAANLVRVRVRVWVRVRVRVRVWVWVRVRFRQRTNAPSWPLSAKMQLSRNASPG